MVYLSEVLDSSSNIWNGIWNAEAPSRCKSLALQACNEVLLVKCNTPGGCNQVATRCAICAKGIETTIHAFLLCEDAKRVWFASPLGLRVESLRNVATLAQWMEQCVDILDDGAMGLVCAILWALWERRVAWVKLKKKMNFMQVLDIAKSVFAVVPAGPRAWVPPVCPFVKANFAAAVKDNVGTAMGVVFRDSFGTTQASGTNFLEDECFEPLIAEALCFRWALEQSGDLGFSKIVFETDSPNLFTQWEHSQGRASVRCYLHSILKDCMIMIKGTRSFMRLVRPSANKLAQSLATVAFDYGDKIWLEMVPEEASMHLVFDLANA